LQLDYLLKLTTGIYASAVVFKSYRNEFPLPDTAKTRIANKIRKIFMNETERKFFSASLEGEEQGRKILNGTFKI